MQRTLYRSAGAVRPVRPRYGVSIYNDLVGLPMPANLTYKQGVRLWYPMRDFMAFRQLRAMNEISLGEWVRSIWHWQALPFFSPTDPLPTLVPALVAIKGRLQLAR